MAYDVGDLVAEFVAACGVRTVFGVEPGFAAEFGAMKAKAMAAFRETLGAYGGFSAQLRAAMPKDALWVRDITLNNSTWGTACSRSTGRATASIPWAPRSGRGCSSASARRLAAAAARRWS